MAGDNLTQPMANSDPPPREAAHQGQQHSVDNAPDETIFRPNISDAVIFLYQVKDRLSGKWETYLSFLELFEAYKRDDLDTPELYARVCSLLKDYPDLLKGFSRFLPPHMKRQLARPSQTVPAHPSHAKEHGKNDTTSPSVTAPKTVRRATKTPRRSPRNSNSLGTTSRITKPSKSAKSQSPSGGYKPGHVSQADMATGAALVVRVTDTEVTKPDADFSEGHLAVSEGQQGAEVAKLAGHLRDTLQ